MTNEANPKSMWSIPEAEERPPLSILKEQSNILTEQTKGDLRGDVTFVKKGPQSSVTLHVIAPFLDNHRAEVVTYIQPISIYPGRLFSSFLDESNPRILKRLDDQYIAINNIKEFEEELQAILSSRRVSQLLSGLLAQTRALSET